MNMLKAKNRLESSNIYNIQTDNSFVTLKVGRKNLLSVLENMVPVPFDVTLVCKAKIVIRKFSKSKSEKLTFKLRWSIFVI
jgi:hypothetical protein